MITYEASLVCDGCKAATAGNVTPHMQLAHQSAIATGEYRYWLVIPPRHGDGGRVLCPTCRNKSHEIPSQNKT